MISAPLESLFSILVSFLVVSAIRSLGIALIVALALKLFRVKSSVFRLSVWTGFLYVALGMPLLSWFLPAIPLPIRMLSNSQLASFVSESKVNVPSENPHAKVTFPILPGNANQFPFLPGRSLAATAYLLVTGFLLMRLILGWVMSRRIRHVSRPIADPEILEILTNRSKEGLKRTPALADTTAVVVPITIGCFRPMILLPADWRNWENSKLSAVLAHELSHVARRDYLRQIMAGVHISIFWFSPLAWLLKNHLAELAEQIGDDSAISAISDRVHYAEILLGFITAIQSHGKRVFMQQVSMARTRHAGRRIDHVLSGSLQSRCLKRSSAVGLVLLIVPLAYLTASVRPFVQTSISADRIASPSMTAPSGTEKADAALAATKPGQVPRRSTFAQSTSQSAEQTRITDQKLLRAIEINGSTYFSPEVLKDELRVAKVNSRVTSEMVDYDIDANLKKFLKENGFIQADVRWNYAVLDGDDIAIHLIINEGPQFRLSDLSVKGVTVFEPTLISSQFDLRPGDIFNVSTAKNALERIKQIYADQGYIKLSYIPEMNFDPSARTATMTFTFDEGIQFHLAYVTFVGTKNQAQEDRLRALTNIRHGDVYSAAVVKSDLDQLKKLGVTKSTVEIVDDQRGLIGITFWLQSPQ